MEGGAAVFAKQKQREHIEVGDLKNGSMRRRKFTDDHRSPPQALGRGAEGGGLDQGGRMTPSEREAVAVVLAHFGLPFERVYLDCKRGREQDLFKEAARSYRAIAHSMTLVEKLNAVRNNVGGR
jgi:hypothetical protein